MLAQPPDNGICTHCGIQVVPTVQTFRAGIHIHQVAILIVAGLSDSLTKTRTRKSQKDAGSLPRESRRQAGGELNRHSGKGFEPG